MQLQPPLKPIPWPEYEARWAPVHDAVFSRREPEDGPFADAGWPIVLLVGGLRIDNEVFLALAGAAGAQGDDEFVVAYRRTAFDDPPPVRAPWTLPALEQVRTDTPFGHVPVDVFGASGTWGMVASPEDFAVLGAAPAVMDDFLRRLKGGAERLRAEFAEAAREGGIGYGDAGRRYAELLMRRVGWMGAADE